MMSLLTLKTCSILNASKLKKEKCMKKENVPKIDNVLKQSRKIKD